MRQCSPVCQLTWLAERSCRYRLRKAGSAASEPNSRASSDCSKLPCTSKCSSDASLLTPAKVVSLLLASTNLRRLVSVSRLARQRIALWLKSNSISLRHSSKPDMCCKGEHALIQDGLYIIGTENAAACSLLKCSYALPALSRTTSALDRQVKCVMDVASKWPVAALTRSSDSVPMPCWL